MKQINKGLLYMGVAACMLFTASSCSKAFLDEKPSTAVPSDEAITSVGDLKSAVNGVYSQLIDFSYYGGNFTLYADLKGSDFRSMGSYNQISPLGKYQHDKYANFPNDFYSIMYVTLARVNDILDAAALLNVANADTATVKDLKGQLYAVRGMVHFDLARLFAQLPTVAASMSAANSGVVLADKKFPVDYKGTRATLQQTYDLIISDFTTSLPLLARAKNNGYINYWAALALRAKVYLYLNKNNEALADAAAVVSGSPYALFTTANLTTVWNREGADETMFEALTTTQYNAQRNSIGYYTHAVGYAECAATDAFYNFMAADANDVRAKLLVHEDDGGDYGAMYPQKYPGRDGNLFLNNPRIMRLAEAYLIAAEAQVKGGTASGALTAAAYINTLRKNRITGYTNVASVTLDDILNERRKELFTEGNMVWDAWRNGKEVTNPTKGVVKGDNPLAILPIPDREMQISGKYGLTQNPGYDQ